MSSELVATYSGLGVQDGDEYFKGEECLGIVFLTIKRRACGSQYAIPLVDVASVCQRPYPRSERG